MTTTDLRIHLYCLCWNDARLLPFFFRHYDPLVEKYFVFDNGSTDKSISILKKHGAVELSHFEVTGDSFVDEERRLGDTIWQGSDADWVIVTDIDEHIYHPDLREYLRSCRREGVTAIQSIGYEMTAENFPRSRRRLVDLVTTGTRSVGHDRLCIFDPKAVTETNYEPGRHKAFPKGRVVWPADPEVLLLHYKQLGVDYAIARSAELRQGLKTGDLEKGWGVHYTWSVAEIKANWRRLRSASGPVPGLGTLKHIEPSKYCYEQRVVRMSGLFDEDWYLRNNPDVESVGADPLTHFCIDGWREGRKPNFYFDPKWYRRHYPRLSAKGRNPLFDYVTVGEEQNACPSAFFNTAWYRLEHGLPENESPLRHYLLGRKSGSISPNPEFDVSAYCREHPEVLSEREDPFESYCNFNS